MRINKQSPVAAELEALYQRNRGLKPKTVVDWARKHPKSALYGRFTWDDSEAAEQYRIWQARELITEVEVIYPDGKPRQVYVSPVSVRKTTGYVALADVMTNTDQRKEFLAQALEEYQRVGRKYADLQELAGVRDAVARAVAAASKPRRKAVACQ